MHFSKSLIYKGIVLCTLSELKLTVFDIIISGTNPIPKGPTFNPLGTTYVIHWAAFAWYLLFVQNTVVDICNIIAFHFHLSLYPSGTYIIIQELRTIVKLFCKIFIKKCIKPFVTMPCRFRTINKSSPCTKQCIDGIEYAGVVGTFPLFITQAERPCDFLLDFLLINCIQ